jgi:pimeloyl-ACP methyl ester carboxylesterase
MIVTGEDPAGAGLPPVLLAHGLFGSARNLGGLARRLAGTRRGISVDMRNHGDSPHDPDHGYPALAADLAEVIEAQGACAAVVGHSMGGKAAMMLALRRPDHVARLVTVDIAPVAYDHASFAAFIAAMRALDLTQVHRRGDADKALEVAVPDVAMRAFLLQNLESGGRGGFRWRANLDVLADTLPNLVGWALPDDATPFQKPTLFIKGGQSGYLKDGAVDETRRLFPGARIETVPDAAHWPHVENPETFMAILTHFLDGA